MDEFRTIDEDDPPRLDLSPDTTQGRIYRFLSANSARAFRQRGIIDAVEGPPGSVGPTLSRLEAHGLLEHRDRVWAPSDHEQADVTTGRPTAQAADERGGGFTDEEIDAWMEAAVGPRTGARDGRPEQL